ncbi:hypothetical protein [Streptomyces sp. HB132]|nr:hypothetical protein [Streptomyces sp. HB132]MBM7443220.1 hypothetical protein [Streptomyces sp. HB132]
MDALEGGSDCRLKAALQQVGFRLAIRAFVVVLAAPADPEPDVTW